MSTALMEAIFAVQRKTAEKRNPLICNFPMKKSERTRKIEDSQLANVRKIDLETEFTPKPL